MSEQVADYPPFSHDIHANASINAVYGPQTAIISIVDSDNEAYGEDKPYDEYEHDLIALRRQIMKEADASVRQKEYLDAISKLRYVLSDIEHNQQLNQSREFAIREIMELCYELSLRAKGSVAIAKVTAMPDVAIPRSRPIIEPIAS